MNAEWPQWASVESRRLRLRVYDVARRCYARTHTHVHKLSLGLTSKWTYLARTIPDIEDLLQPLEDAIRQQFLPSLTGQVTFGDALMALPVRLGGLGVINPSRQSTAHNNMSKKITAPLVALILQQSHVLSPETKDEQLRARKDSCTLRRQRANQPLPPTSRRGCPEIFRELWKRPRRRVPQVGSPPCQSLSMDSPSTREHSEMPSAYGMAGVRYVFLPIASVEGNSPLSMH